MVLVTVSCNKVDDISLDGELFTQIYPIKNCNGHMRFNKNTVTITYADCKLYKGYWDIYTSESTYNYSYKNGILTIDDLEVLSYEDDKIIIKWGNVAGYTVFQRYK